MRSPGRTVTPNRIVLAFGLFLFSSILLPASDALGASRDGRWSKRTPSNVPGSIHMKTPENSRYLPGRVIVKLNQSIPARAGRSPGIPALDAAAQRYSAQSVAQIFPEATLPAKPGEGDLSRIYVINYSSPFDAFTVAKELSALPEVEYAEPWFIYSIDDARALTPNDSLYANQWALVKIKADSAWSVSTGDTSVVIGIVDTGVQWDHPDLAANIWINPGETGLDSLGRDKRTNGVDDDNNGKIDDWHGWDFGGADFNAPVEDNNPRPTADNTAHGTHVAGIASGVTNNFIGIAGVGYKCKILAVKTAADNDTRGGGVAYIIAGFQGIVYAAKMGAKVINCSWGGPGYSQFEQDVINYATQQGALVVAAAGNANKAEPNYPAAYANVISVAATNTSDVRTYYSNYGPSIDVCAPGGDFVTGNSPILSTYFPSTYGLLAGTSQASPHVAGVAALVKSVFPSYTPLQVGEQVRVTCDDISSLNPLYANDLGKGRINAYRAVTASSPSLRLTTVLLKDSVGGNNNGVPDPNETVSIVATFVDYLQATSGSASITLSATDTNVQVINGSYPIGIVGTLQSATNAASPFTFHVSANVPQTDVVSFRLTVTDGGYQDFQYFKVLINPSYATHDINNVRTTVTNNGKIGFNDYPGNTQGVGFVYGGANQLYEGGLLMGYSPTKLVNVVRNQTGTQADMDFSSGLSYSLRTPGLVSDQDGQAVFSDSAAPLANRVGVQVKMYSYAFAADSQKDYVIVRYDIRNVSGATLSNFYAGLFFDWDMRAPDPANDTYYSHNKTSFDSSRGLGYAWYDTTAPTIYCGARALDGAAGYAGLRADSITGFRDEKWAWLSGGIKMNSSTTDIHFAISSGPYSLSNGGTQTVGFALLGGTSLATIQSHSDSALQKWQYIRSLIGYRPRLSVAIHQNPALSRYADLYVSSDIVLITNPAMVIKVGAGPGDSVSMTQVSPNIFKGSYQFSSTGSSTISVSATGINGLDTLVIKTFQVQLLKRGLASTIHDPENAAVLAVPAGAIDEDTYFTVFPEESRSSKPLLIGKTYAFGPGREFTSALSLTLQYPRNLVKPGSERHLNIYQQTGNGWVPLRSWVDLERTSVTAAVTSLGTFALGYDDPGSGASVPITYLLEKNFPNPFNPQTAIRYGLPQNGYVRLTVFDVMGKEVTRLVDGEREAGSYEVVWGGTNGGSRTVASGVYFYSLEAYRAGVLTFRKTDKMLFIR